MPEIDTMQDLELRSALSRKTLTDFVNRTDITEFNLAGAINGIGNALDGILRYRYKSNDSEITVRDVVLSNGIPSVTYYFSLQTGEKMRVSCAKDGFAQVTFGKDPSDISRIDIPIHGQDRLAVAAVPLPRGLIREARVDAYYGFGHGEENTRTYVEMTQAAVRTILERFPENPQN